jgi:flagellar assembly protein FliH
MSARPKYLFDLDFATGAGASARPTITLAEHEAKCAENEAQAYRNGVAAAEAQSHANAEQRIAAVLELIADGVEKLNRGLSTIETRLEIEAIEVAVAVANKLAPELIAREPFAEIAALATECFRHLVAAPHVVVRLNDALYATAREKLEEIVAARGFEGRLVVLAEPEIGVDDCRIEWADGGVNRDRTQTEAAIDEVVGRYVAARTTLTTN